MSSLSISKAWDESRAILTRDGKLIAAVATALIGLPTMISTLIAPSAAQEVRQAFEPKDAIVLALTLFMLAGQLAIVRLALAPSMTVGAAIAHGFRRMPMLLLALVMLMLALFFPFGMAATMAGISFEPGIAPNGTAVLILFVFLIILAFVGVRMMVSSAVASAEAAGPVQIIRRSWRLTAGHFWKLFGFILMFFVAALVAVLAIGAAVGAIVALLMGPVEPLSASALVVGLAQGIFNAALTAVLAVMTARIYVQLSGRESVTGAEAVAEA